MAETKRLSGQALKRLSRVSDGRGAVDAGVAWVLILGSTWAARASGAWFVVVPAVLVIVSRQAAIANLAHDAWHRLCFSSRPVNDAVGAWLYSYPVGVPYFHDRHRHLSHHRLVGEPHDPDWVNYSNAGRESKPRVVRYLGGRLLGMLLVDTAWSVLVRRKPRIAVEAKEAASGEPRHEMLRVVVCQLTLIGLYAALFGWWSYFAFWLAPLATLTAFCNALRAFVEHAVADPGASPGSRLADIEAGLLERTFFSPAHFHFHALHHAHPTIPHHRLPEAKRTLAEECAGYPYPVLPGYLRALRAHLGALGSPPGGSE